MTTENNNFSRPPTSIKLRRFNWSTFIFGYDFFISFKLGPPPIGTQSYASDLARRLSELDYTVFFSEEEAQPGLILDSTLIKALNRSKNLVVIANEGALIQSQWVRKEVEEFRRKHPKKSVIPINVDRAIEKFGDQVNAKTWLAPKGVIWLDETYEAIKKGISTKEKDTESTDVVMRLQVIPRFTKANTRFRGLVILTMLVLIGLGTYSWNKKTESQQRYIAYNLNQGRTALVNGRLFEAAPSLVRAYKEGVDTPALRLMLARSFSPLDSLLVNIENKANAFSLDGSLFALALKDGTVQIWDLKTQKLAVTMPDKVPNARSIVFSPDNSHIAIAEGQKKLDVPDCLMGTTAGDISVSYWEVSTGIHLGTLKPLETLEGCWLPFFAEKGRTLAIANWTTATPDLYWLITKFDAQTLHIVSATKPIQDEICKYNSPDVISNKLNQEGSIVGCYGELVAISEDGELAAYAPWDIPQRQLTLWNVRDGADKIIDFHRDTSVLGARFNLSNQKIAITLTDAIEIWDVKKAKIIQSIPVVDNPTIPAEFSPDGRRLVVLTGQRSAAIFDVRNGYRFAQLEGHSAEIKVASFSPDGDQILTASDDGETKVWDAWTGMLLNNFEGHGKPLTKALFSPDQRIIVTEEKAQRLKIWRNDSPLKPRIFRNDPTWMKWGSGDRYCFVEYSKDGNKVILKQNDVWDIWSDDKENVFNFNLWDLSKGVLIGLSKEANLLFQHSKNIISECNESFFYSEELLKQDLNDQSEKNEIASGNKSKFTLIRDRKAPNQALLKKGEDNNQLISLNGHKSFISLGAFSEADEFVYTLDVDGTMLVWSVDDGSLISHLSFPKTPVAVHYLPNQKLITLHEQNQAVLWTFPQEVRKVDVLDREIQCSGLFPSTDLIGFAEIDLHSCHADISLSSGYSPSADIEAARAFYTMAWSRRHNPHFAESILNSAIQLYERQEDNFGLALCHLALRAIAIDLKNDQESNREAGILRTIVNNMTANKNTQLRVTYLGALAFNEFGDNEIARYAYKKALELDPKNPEAMLAQWEVSVIENPVKVWLKKFPEELVSSSNSERIRIFKWMNLLLLDQKNDEVANEAWSMYTGDTRNPISENLDFRGLRRELDKASFSPQRKKHVIQTLELLELPGDQANKLKKLLGVRLDRGLVGP